MRLSLEIVGYCRQRIPHFSLTVKSLIQLIHSDVSDPVAFADKCLKTFQELKDKLCRAPALGMLNYEEVFPILSRAKWVFIICYYSKIWWSDEARGVLFLSVGSFSHSTSWSFEVSCSCLRGNLTE